MPRSIGFVTQHPCACYIEAKLYGFNALVPKRTSLIEKLALSKNERLEKGPAYNLTLDSGDSTFEPSD